MRGAATPALAATAPSSQPGSFQLAQQGRRCGMAALGQFPEKSPVCRDPSPPDSRPLPSPVLEVTFCLGSVPSASKTAETSALQHRLRRVRWKSSTCPRQRESPGVSLTAAGMGQESQPAQPSLPDRPTAPAAPGTGPGPALPPPAPAQQPLQGHPDPSLPQLTARFRT